MISFTKDLVLDARTEWSIRWTVLLAICYAFFFYPPSSAPSWIDWSLPVQLASGGNLGFYNVGFHAWFGVGAAVAMVLAGCFLSIILPLLRDDNLVGAYVSLMVMLSAVTLPMIYRIGVLNNLSSIAVLLILIFTEVFYGPILNLRSVLPDASAIFSEVIRGNAVPAIIYVGFSWAVYAIPPWHSGIHQSFSLVSSVLSGTAQFLSLAADAIESIENNDDDKKRECRDALRELSRSLFEETNSAGLQVPVALYGEQGLYEVSLLYPFCSLGYNIPNELGRTLDETTFHVAIVVWALGTKEVLDSVANNLALRAALVANLRASAELAKATASVIACPRKNWSSGKADCRQGIADNARLFGGTGQAVSTSDAQKNLQMAMDQCKCSEKQLQENARDAESPFYGILLWEVVKDLTFGHRQLAHQSNSSLKDNDSSSVGEGSLGRMTATTVNAQSSWGNSMGFARQLLRLSYMEQMLILIKSWIEGCAAAYSTACLNIQHSKSFVTQPILRRRGVRRALQFVTGTWALYAMATWWDEYSTMLGSSSTGQWTLVAFYVCFRATCEETVNAAILRSIGHALGALLSWGINTAATTNGARMGAHLAINAVFTWFIPPPFVFPSSLTFGFDRWLGEGLLEGALTTYHLTSVLVFSTSIESAAKARALSQCLGALAAALVSLLIFPWSARVETKRTLERFIQTSRDVVDNLGTKRIPVLRGSLYGSVEELLQARRDWSGAIDSKGWFVSLLDSLHIKANESDDASMSNMLSRAAIGGFALEGILKHVDLYATVAGKDAASSLIGSIGQLLRVGKYDDSMSLLKDTISTIEPGDAARKQKEELATICVLVLLLRESSILLFGAEGE